MTQPRHHSLAESVVSTALGVVLSFAAVQFLFPLFGVRLSLPENAMATAVFTVMSVARQYIVRRAFNAWGRP